MLVGRDSRVKHVIWVLVAKGVSRSAPCKTRERMAPKSAALRRLALGANPDPRIIAREQTGRVPSISGARKPVAAGGLATGLSLA